MQTTPSIIQLIFDKAFNEGDLTIIDEFLSPDHLAHSTFGGAPNGPQGFKWLVVQFRSAFPDLRCTIEDEIKVGEKAAAHFTMRGTHKGSFLGNLPTGRTVLVRGIIFARIENGQMVEDWTLIDQLGILQQLGLVPPLGGH